MSALANAHAAPEGRHALEVSNVSKTFDTRTGAVTALSEVDLEIRDGEFIAIVGASGQSDVTSSAATAGTGP